MARMTAGRRLRRTWDAALRAEATRLRQPLEWTELELRVLAAAESAEHRREQLQACLDAELAGERSPAVLTKLSAEVRLTEKAVLEHLSRLSLAADGGSAAKSPRHARAAEHRWAKRDAAAGQ